MACFLVPTAEAIVVTTVNKLSAKKETKKTSAVEAEKAELSASSPIPFREKLKWLQGMLWGGAVLLAFEHIWHGEIVPWFPFLTAAENPDDFAKMLGEMSTTGILMAVLVTAAWALMLLGVHIIKSRKISTQDFLKKESVR